MFSFLKRVGAETILSVLLVIVATAIIGAFTYFQIQLDRNKFDVCTQKQEGTP